MGGLLDLLRGAVDTFDAIPGIDPDPTKRGVISHLLGINDPKRHQPKLDQFLNQASNRFAQQPSSRSRAGVPASSVDGPMTPPGGAIPAPRMNPPNPADYLKSHSIVDVLNPFYSTVNHDLDAMHRLKTDRGSYDAQQAQMASQQQWNERTQQGTGAGLSGRELLDFQTSGEVPELQQITAGNTYLNGSNFERAPLPLQNVTDPYGRNVTFDPLTGERGSATDPVKPVSVTDGSHLVDPLSGDKIYENFKDVPPSDLAPDVAQEGVLRREFNSMTRPFREVHSAYARIKATDTSTPAGQMGLIFQYMKMLDPGSTVREGEYATAQNTTGVPGQVRNLYNQMLQGKFLTPEQIQDFEGQAGSLYQAAEQNYGAQVQRYQGIAESYNYPSNRVVVDIRGDAGPTRINNDDEYDALPSGTRYIGPDNQPRIKP